MVFPDMHIFYSVGTLTKYVLVIYCLGMCVGDFKYWSVLALNTVKFQLSSLWLLW